MGKLIAALFLSLVGLIVVAQEPPQGKAGQVIFTGTVTNFEIAKSIEVTAGGVSHKYDLNDSDTVYSIGPEVAEGCTVTVTERTDSEGRKNVSIGLAAKG